MGPTHHLVTNVRFREAKSTVSVKSVLGLPSVHSHKVFKMLCIYFMITVFNTKNQFYYYLVQKKKDAFWRPLGIKKAHHRWALAL